MAQVNYTVEQIRTSQTEIGGNVDNYENANYAQIQAPDSAMLIFRIIPDSGYYVKSNMFVPWNQTSGGAEEGTTYYQNYFQPAPGTSNWPEYVYQIQILDGYQDENGQIIQAGTETEAQNVYVKILLDVGFQIPENWAPTFSIIVDIDGDAQEIIPDGDGDSNIDGSEGDSDNNQPGEVEYTNSFTLTLAMASGADSGCKISFLPCQANWYNLTQGAMAQFGMFNNGYKFDLNKPAEEWESKVTFTRVGGDANTPILSESSGNLQASYGNSNEVWFFITPKYGYAINRNCLSVKILGGDGNPSYWNMEPGFQSAEDTDQGSTHDGVIPTYMDELYGGTNPGVNVDWAFVMSQSMPRVPMEEQLGQATWDAMSDWFEASDVAPDMDYINAMDSNSESYAYNQENDLSKLPMILEDYMSYLATGDTDLAVFNTTNQLDISPATQFRNAKVTLSYQNPEEEDVVMSYHDVFTSMGDQGFVGWGNNDNNPSFSTMPSIILGDTKGFSPWSNTGGYQAYYESLGYTASTTNMNVFRDFLGQWWDFGTIFPEEWPIWRWPWDWWQNNEDENGEPIAGSFPYNTNVAQIPGPYCPSDYSGNGVWVALTGLNNYVPGDTPPDIRIEIEGRAMNFSDDECVNYDVDITF